MLFKNIYVYKSTGAKVLKHVLVNDKGLRTIFNLDEELPPLQQNVMDCKGNYFLLPGMLDSHVHGQGGIDFSDLGDEFSEQKLEHLVTALGKTGLSYALATFVSLPIPSLKKSLSKLNEFIEKQERTPIAGCTQILGVHLEGPFISKKCKGAHAEETLQERINIEQFRDIIGVAPHIKNWKITLAADLPGAEEFIKNSKNLEREGIFVKVFLGHCNPDNKEDIDKAIAAGAIGFTHLGNACQESCSRETRELTLNDVKSTLVQWVLENPERCPPGVEIIADGSHLSSSFISLIHKAINKKMILITDALGPTGCDDGIYKLGALDIRKQQNAFYLADEKGDFQMREGILPSGEKGLVRILAGSAAPLSYCAQKYFESIEGEQPEVRMDLLFHALITNPRTASLSTDSINTLNDHNNFSIFNEKGQLILSSCQGQIIHHQQTQWPIANILQYGFLSKMNNPQPQAPEVSYKVNF